MKYSDWRPSDQKIYVSDIKKAKKLLGWKPRVEVEKGIDCLCKWVQENKELF